MKRDLRYGNLAKVQGNVGARLNSPAPILAQCVTAYQDSATNFWRVNCIAVRFGTPYQGIPVVTQVEPLPNSMGMLLFMDGDSQVPYFLPTGW